MLLVLDLWVVVGLGICTHVVMLCAGIWGHSVWVEYHEKMEYDRRWNDDDSDL